jgi:hypothetical protein
MQKGITGREEGRNMYRILTEKPNGKLLPESQTQQEW